MRLRFFTLVALVGLAACGSPTSPTNQPGQNYNSPTLGALVPITGGTFANGTANMTVSSFALSPNLITEAQWQTVTQLPNPSFYQGATLPFENANWYACLVFCNDLSQLENLTPVYSILGSTNPALWGKIPVTDSPAWDAVQINRSANGYRLPTEGHTRLAPKAQMNFCFMI